VSLRRLLLLTLVFYCASLLAQEVKTAPTDCPPSDGYEWVKFKDRPSGKVLWVQTRTQQQFERLCGRASGCALRFEEVTVIVSQSPGWAVSESFREHEECHDGWDHTRGSALGSLLR
jgi:hypothetical protein